MTQRRIAGLDTLRTLSIMLVVFCHFVLLPDETVAGNVFMALATGAVPCFVLVSGALLHQKQTLDLRTHGVRVLRLLAGLAAWRAIYLAAMLLFGRISLPSPLRAAQYLFLLAPLEGVNADVMWYMIGYVMLLLVYPATWFLFRDKTGKKILFGLLIVSFVQGILLPGVRWLGNCAGRSFGWPTPNFDGLFALFPFSGAAYLLFYFLAGAFLFEYKDDVFRRFGRWKAMFPLGAAVGLCGLLWAKFAETGSWRWENIYLSDSYTHLSTVFLSIGAFLTALAFPMGAANRLLAPFGKYTMGVYYMHFILLACLAPALDALSPYRSFGLNCLKAAAVWALCTAVSWILAKIPVVRHLVR